MNKEVVGLVVVFLLFLAGLVIYIKFENSNGQSFSDGKVPYSNIAEGVLYEITPESILDDNEIQFWHVNTLNKKSFTIDSKIGQVNEEGILFNYSISSSEDCEKEFDKRNYSVSVYYQSSGFSPQKYNLHTARSCWIESILPSKLICEEESANCLYASKVNCVCVYASRK